MLKGVIIDIDGVMTGTEPIFYHLKTVGLKLATASSFANPKPAPDLFLTAAKELGLLPEECLVITDSETGTIAAKAAGVPCIGFINPDSGKENLSRAYALLESFASVDAAYLHRTHAHAMSYPAEILTTKRLLIREFSKEDFPSLYPMCSNPETASFMEETPADYETEQEKHLSYISNIYPIFDLALWGVFEKNTGTLIGRAGFSLPEDENGAFSLGYLIDVSYRKQGYAKECIPALLAYAKDLGYTTISAKVKTDNPASQRVLNQCGFPYHYTTDDTGRLLLYTIRLTI